MKSRIDIVRSLSIKYQVILSALSLGLYFFTSSILEQSYANSNFPVPYFVGQTSFSAESIKEWYQFMIDAGSFDIYLKTQLIDFAFIVSVVLMGFFIWTLIASLHKQKSVFKKWGYIFAFSLPLAGLFDIFENVVSFLMINNPTDFSNWLAILYSTFASIKFVFWSVGLFWLGLSIIMIVFTKMQEFFK